MRDEECDGFGTSAVDPDRDPSSVSSLKSTLKATLVVYMPMSAAGARKISHFRIGKNDFENRGDA